MLSLGISIMWVCLSTLTLGVKAVFMLATKKDVERVGATMQHIRDHYHAFRMGNKIMWPLGLFGLLIAWACVMLGIIKVWVFIIDAVLFVVCVILNIVFLGYLRKKAKQ